MKVLGHKLFNKYQGLMLFKTGANLT